MTGLHRATVEQGQKLALSAVRSWSKTTWHVAVHDDLAYIPVISFREREMVEMLNYNKSPEAIHKAQKP